MLGVLVCWVKQHGVAAATTQQTSEVCVLLRGHREAGELSGAAVAEAAAGAGAPREIVDSPAHTHAHIHWSTRTHARRSCGTATRARLPFFVCSTKAHVFPKFAPTFSVKTVRTTNSLTAQLIRARVASSVRGCGCCCVRMNATEVWWRVGGWGGWVWYSGGAAGGLGACCECGGHFGSARILLDVRSGDCVVIARTRFGNFSRFCWADTDTRTISVFLRYECERNTCARTRQTRKPTRDCDEPRAHTTLCV